ncbi:MAG: hypothetical protein HY520_03290 [Candidatus Aenigmarchaeota archaeon]|nr:hypothetical protein [Candidatus Aenigmarchaeota archaeon]
MDRLIRNVKKEEWKTLKVEAARHGLPIAAFLGHLLEEHRDRPEGRGWEAIRNSKRIFTDAEAKEMKKAAAAFEKIEEEE